MTTAICPTRKQFNLLACKASNGILRPLINAAQMMTVVLMFPVDWPESIMVMTHILEGINFSFVKPASPSCIGVPINFY